MKEDYQVYRLGHRAFFLFLSRRIKFSMFLFLLTAAVWLGGLRWASPFWLVWTDYAAEMLLYISIAYLLVILLRTLLEYRAYTYAFTDEAFVVTRGYLMRTEIATLYHQIQNVNIERRMFDRLNGVSSIVILLTGGQHETHNKIVLPAIGKTRAKSVQKELLVRARRHAAGGDGEGEGKGYDEREERRDGRDAFPRGVVRRPVR